MQCWISSCDVKVLTFEVISDMHNFNLMPCFVASSRQLIGRGLMDSLAEFSSAEETISNP